MRANLNIAKLQSQRQAVRRIDLALSMISTGIPYQDQQIRRAILSELAGTTEHEDLLKKPFEILEAIAFTINIFSRRLMDGIVFETLLDLQTEARAIFARMDRP